MIESGTVRNMADKVDPVSDSKMGRLIDQIADRKSTRLNSSHCG